jgi:phenylalanyl-tRNA synthetase beta chain
LPREEVRLGAVVMGRRRPPHFTEPQPPVFDEWDAKAIAEVAAEKAYAEVAPELVPGSTNLLWRVRVGGRTVGQVVRLAVDAPVWAAPAYGIELILGDMETAAPADPGQHAYIEAVPSRTAAARRYRALPTMPPAEIDIALLVPHGTTAADVERVIRVAAGPLLEKLALFDQYTGAGIAPEYRSLAWRLTFRHPDRTLRDKEIEARRATILAALQEELNVGYRTA